MAHRDDPLINKDQDFSRISQAEMIRTILKLGLTPLVLGVIIITLRYYNKIKADYFPLADRDIINVILPILFFLGSSVLFFLGYGLLYLNFTSYITGELSKSWSTVMGRILRSEKVGDWRRFTVDLGGSIHLGSTSEIYKGSSILYSYIAGGIEYVSNRVRVDYAGLLLGKVRSTSSEYTANQDLKKYPVDKEVTVYYNPNQMELKMGLIKRRERQLENVLESVLKQPQFKNAKAGNSVLEPGYKFIGDILLFSIILLGLGIYFMQIAYPL